jgi:hypothetical protein
MNDLQLLDSEFQEQVLLNGKMASSVEAVRKELTTERDQLRLELEELKRTAAEWSSERAMLVAECERATHLLEQSRNEHDRAIADTDEAAAIALERQIATAIDRVRAELTTRWEAERTHLVAERNRAQQRLADAAADHERQLADAAGKARSEFANEREELRRELEEAKHVTATTPAGQSSAGNETIQAEIARVEDVIRAISQVISDPTTELSVVIRKNAERAELESYLRGLRFKISDK